MVALSAHVLKSLLLLQTELERLLKGASVTLWDMVGLVGAEDVLDVAPVLTPRGAGVAFPRGEERVVHRI